MLESGVELLHSLEKKLTGEKGKPSGSIASVLLKMFISGNEMCHPTDAPLQIKSGTLFFSNRIH